MGCDFEFRGRGTEESFVGRVTTEDFVYFLGLITVAKDNFIN